MSAAEVYADHAATSPLRPEAADAMAALGPLANPSSTHRAGQRASALLEEARERVAACLGAHPTEVLFTSGGTEALNLALQGNWNMNGHEGRAVASAIEHAAVTETLEWMTHEGLEVDWVAPIQSGAVDAADFVERCRPAFFATLQWANNETGVLQPIAEVAAGLDRATQLHVDAVAAVGHVPVRMMPGISTLSLSAHKFGGPTGVGALIAARDAGLVPLLHGGGQQRGLRPGTADVAGAVGMAAALEAACAQMEAEAERLARLGERIRASVRGMPGVVLTEGNVLPSHVHLTVQGADAAALTFLLDAAGVAASNGAACSAGVVQPSHVMLAMGRTGAPLRLSLGWTTTDADAERVAAVLPEAIRRAQRAR